MRVSFLSAIKTRCGVLLERKVKDGRYRGLNTFIDTERHRDNTDGSPTYIRLPRDYARCCFGTPFKRRAKCVRTAFYRTVEVEARESLKYLDRNCFGVNLAGRFFCRRFLSLDLSAYCSLVWFVVFTYCVHRQVGGGVRAAIHRVRSPAPPCTRSSWAPNDEGGRRARKKVACQPGNGRKWDDGTRGVV